jgi:N-methylhydantoinase B
VIKALSPAIPARVAAAHYGDSMVVWFDGRDPRYGNTRFFSVEANPGGWGGYEGGDGQDALINSVNGPFKDLPVEVYEQKYPIMIREYGIRVDTGGPGRFRGGCGVYRTYQMEAPASLFLWFERSVTPAWGLFGGGDAAGPDVVVRRAGEAERHVLKVGGLEMRSGDSVRYHTGGGGGYGPPWERDPLLVREDVLDGYVTVHAAAKDYGVVLRPDLTIDQKATARLRDGMAREGAPAAGGGNDS